MVIGDRFVEHVGEVEVGLEAATEEGTFEQALVALAELVEAGGDGEPVSREIEVVAEEDALLVVE